MSPGGVLQPALFLDVSPLVRHAIVPFLGLDVNLATLVAGRGGRGQGAGGGLLPGSVLVVSVPLVPVLPLVVVALVLDPLFLGPPLVGPLLDCFLRLGSWSVTPWFSLLISPLLRNVTVLRNPRRRRESSLLSMP